MKKTNLCIFKFLLLLILSYSKLIPNLKKKIQENQINLKQSVNVTNENKLSNINTTSIKLVNSTEFKELDFQVDNDELKMIKKFKEWHKANNKQYSLDSTEASKRFATFKENYKYITSQNKKSTFVMGLGPFADMNFEEFTKKVLGKGPVGEFAKLINQNIKDEVNED
jgi:hypothetical protein